MAKKKFKIDLGKAVMKLDIATKQTLTTQGMGGYKSVFKGRGLEFAEYRIYTPGEDASLIDWKASARSPHILVKEFVEERNLRVFFLIDVSASMVFGSTNKLKNEYAAELIAALSFSILDAGDTVGYALFSDTIERKSKPMGGATQYYRLTRDLVNPEFYGGGYNFVTALEFLTSFLQGTHLVIIVSDFIGLKGGWEQKLKLAGNKFDVIGMMVRDPRDIKMPAGVGQVVIEDPFTKVQTLIDPDQIRPLYSRVTSRQITNIKNAFLKNNCDFVDFYTDQPYVKRIISFFKMREIKLA